MSPPSTPVAPEAPSEESPPPPGIALMNALDDLKAELGPELDTRNLGAINTWISALPQNSFGLERARLLLGGILVHNLVPAYEPENYDFITNVARAAIAHVGRFEQDKAESLLIDLLPAAIYDGNKPFISWALTTIGSLRDSPSGFSKIVRAVVSGGDEETLRWALERGPSLGQGEAANDAFLASRAHLLPCLVEHGLRIHADDSGWTGLHVWVQGAENEWADLEKSGSPCDFLEGHAALDFLIAQGVDPESGAPDYPSAINMAEYYSPRLAMAIRAAVARHEAAQLASTTPRPQPSPAARKRI